MGACDHSTLVDEPLFGSPHLAPAGAGIGLSGDSLEESCREAALEQHSCLEFAAQSVQEQRSCLEVADVVSNSNADPADAPDGCRGSPLNCEVETSMVKGDGREGEGENVVCLVADKVSCNECGVGGLSLHGSHVESEGLCLEGGGAFSLHGSHVESEGLCLEGGNLSEGCELSSELLPVDGSLNNCAEQNEKNDSKTDDGLSAKRVLEVVDEECKILDGIKVDMCNELLPSSGCEMPVELLQMAGSLSGCGRKNEQNDGVSVNCLTVERVVEFVEGNRVVDMCCQTFMSQDCKKPLELLRLLIR
ncbi:hypothetical protein L1049_025588 [Liquidambar formosana]|uniref:Uncharacterized protein n=1 Tax=Liquidambar formosana TaxID=63359 RepID=A0AAP0R5R0_LIQFO